jgi:hypothetical protein
MKKWLAIAGVAMLVSGCAQQGLPESEYFELVKESPGLAGLENETISGLGADICAALPESGYLEVLALFLDMGVEAGPSGAFIALSVSQYCPEHLDKVPSL